MIQVIVLDQLTKLWIRLNFVEGQSIPVLESLFGSTFRLTYARNQGAAFSFSPASPEFNRILFTSIAFLAVGFIIYLLLRNTHRIQVVAFGLVMGGALGNAIDRILLGPVTDFIDVDLPNFITHNRFPIFNVADSMIFIAMCLLIFEILFIKDSSPRRERSLPREVDIEANNKEI